MLSPNQIHLYADSISASWVDFKEKIKSRNDFRYKFLILSQYAWILITNYTFNTRNHYSGDFI